MEKASGEDATADERHIDWARSFDAATHPFSTSTSVKFLTGDEVRDPSR